MLRAVASAADLIDVASLHPRRTRHENPFEGAANDVPIAQISRLIEVELGQVLGDANLPPLLHETNEIVL